SGGWTGDTELIAELEHHRGGTAANLIALPVELDQLGEALDQSAGGDSFIDLTNGMLWPGELFDVDQGPEDFDPDSERWLLVAGLGSPPAYNTMQRFAATIEQPDLASRLTDALGGSGAFGRFRTELSRHESEYTRWHRFADDARLGRARAWLTDRGYRSDRQR
ncbi:MAG: hypothetical protein GY926_18015, partial [bacterium]|nr:hypothetical protein [bacterium]